MHRLVRSLDRHTESGVALPVVWREFSTLGINLYQGDMLMWASPPGTGKSAMALNYALKAKVPTLYLSCDMGRSLVARRVAGIITETPTDTVRQEMQTVEGEEKYREALSGVDHLYMAYPSRPTAEMMALQLMAFQEIHGLPPDLFILDNLMNASSGAKDEWTGLRDLCQVLHYFATELNICVLVLHHLNLGGLDLSSPAPVNYIKGQVTELPAVVLTAAKGGGGRLMVAPVKNRHGKTDVSGKTYLTLDFDEERQIVSDPKPVTSAYSAASWANATTELPSWIQ